MYSQADEEKYILEAFAGKRGVAELRKLLDSPSRFLDVGAYHPTEKSNTRALFELGWSGVMIEPSPGPMRALLKEYGNEPRITLIQACCSIAVGLVDMFISDDAVSTSDAIVQRTWREAGGYFGRMCVPSITPTQIANQFGGFDFINLDAEGVSVDLFAAMIGLGWRPRCWCVEIDNRQAELAAIAEGAGYKSVNDARFGVLGNGCNAVLVRK